MIKNWQVGTITTVAVLALTTGSSAAAAELKGRVIGVNDGDTITVLSNNHQERIRLADIDCPEIKQPFGNQAKKHCARLCFNKAVSISYSRRDRFKRIVGQVKLPNGHSLNHELVRAGMAWCFTKYCKDPLVSKLEQQARNKRLGLWQDKNPTPPWQWRAQAAQAKAPF
jgi:endonuclease YncB( thermonuclease family)